MHWSRLSSWSRVLLVWACGAAASLAAASAAHASAAEPVERLRIVGGLAGLNQYTRQEEPFWLRELPRLTAGRAVAEIVPFDRAGLGGEEMLRMVQMGAVPFGTALLSRSSAVEPELVGPDLAGLNPDFASVKRHVAAYRPRLSQLLRERYGIELLAIYLYPAQVTFCAKPFAGLSDLAGRRVRVASASQADFMAALGAQPVQTPFAQIVPGIRNGSIDCAITGTMSGNTIGLHEVTSHVHTMAVTWGLAVFVAHGASWEALSDPVRSVLKRELPRLEQRVWAESERETSEGLACNTGGAGCRDGRKGRMTLVSTSSADEKRRLGLLQEAVLPAWIRRCGQSCGTLWRELTGGAMPAR